MEITAPVFIGGFLVGVLLTRSFAPNMFTFSESGDPEGENPVSVFLSFLFGSGTLLLIPAYFSNCIHILLLAPVLATFPFLMVLSVKKPRAARALTCLIIVGAAIGVKEFGGLEANKHEGQDNQHYQIGTCYRSAWWSSGC